MLPGRTWSLTTFLATVLLTARPAAACSDGRAHAAGIASRSECPIPTIVHGQIGVGGTAHFFMETQHLDPTFQGVWEGALEWIMADAQPGDPDWYEHLSSPGPIDTTGFMWEAAYGDFFDGYPGSRPTIWNAEVLARGYLMNGNVAYLPYARGGLQWLLTQNVADVIPWIPGGVGCLYMEWVCATGDIWAAGANAGIASTARYALEIFRSAPPNSVPEAEQIMDCSMEALHALATEDSASGGVYWPADATAPEGEIATGFCAGGSGILRLYLEMLLTFPEDPVIEDLALKSLKLFQHHAIQDSLGTSWPQTIGGTNFPPGVGLGTAGVGRAFLDAYQVFPDSTHYLDYARGAADWLVNVAEKPSPDVIKWLDGGNGYSSTWCRGATGIMYFLWDVGGATGDGEYRRQALKAANFLFQSQMLTTTGSIALPQDEGIPETNTGFIWGIPGLANPIWQPYSPMIDREPLTSVVVNAGHYLDEQKIVAATSPDQYYWHYNVDIDQAPAAYPGAPSGPSRQIVDSFDARAFPNPSGGPFEFEVDGVDLATAGPLSFEIFDVTGRRVASGSTAGPRVTWDGRDERGRPAPQGFYFVRLSSGEATRTLKLALIR